MKNPVNIFWFRRDLRLDDNAGLYCALKDPNPVLGVFIFDKNILDKLENKEDKRVAFIHSVISKMRKQLEHHTSTLYVVYDEPVNAFRQLAEKYDIEKVFTNHDYEPYATQRDNDVKALLAKHNITFQTFKDQVIFDKNEVMKDDGKPYTVFTPYSRKWKERLNDFYVSSYSDEQYFHRFLKHSTVPIPSLSSMGFKEIVADFPSQEIDKAIVKSYNTTRDFPGEEHGTSRMGVHLRFGTISIRKLARFAIDSNSTYLNELIWREFYQMLLWHFPQLGEGHAFKPDFEKIQWLNNEADFEKWCKGMTGYPLVDAGMRQLNETGFMHNRVRMVTASFLSKHLLIDWRWGEAYFAEKLLDYDLASNNGGWQWSAGSGADSAPYFRIFNPTLQTKRFDKDLDYIKKWVPELNELTYPEPLVQHEFARKRALEVYGKALRNK